MKSTGVVWLFGLVGLFFSCVTNTQEEKSVQDSVISVEQGKPISSLPETCKAFADENFKVPYFLASDSFVVTRIVKSCFSKDGFFGYEDGSSWMAMGFPCTGGNGKVVIRGKQANPKMVSFLVSNACPMVPSERNVVRSIGMEKVNIPIDVKLIAYYPFALQFWELVDYGDADTGFSIDFRTRLGLTEGWQAFLNGEPIRLKLYGRENAWVRDNQFFAVDAVLQKENELNFKVSVSAAKALSDQEIAEVKAKCESLRPSRNCTRVFPH